MAAYSLKKNSFLSLVTNAIPALVGLVTIPILIHQLGLERFAFLSIIWAIIGYFGILDLGLSRSLSKRAAVRHSKQDLVALGQDLGFGLIGVGLLGLLVGGVILRWGASFLVAQFQLDPGFVFEAGQSIPVIAASVPVLMLLGAAKGVLEGINQFKLANSIQLANGLSNFLIPTGVAFFDPGLPTILMGLLIFRLGLLGITLKWLHALVPIRFFKGWDHSLVTEGGWLTLSAMASPLMLYVDRIVLGTLIPMKSLAFYTTPVDLISRFWLVPQAITRVTFPAFSYMAKDRAQLQLALAEALDLMLLACLAPIAVVFFFSHEILQYWINQEMAASGALILKILCVGMFWNCLSWLSYSLLQATDGMAAAGIIALLEVPLYFAGLWLLASHYGLLGAALAWSGRLIVDSFILDAYFLWKQKRLTPWVLKKMGLSCLFLVGCVGLHFFESIDLTYRWLAGLFVMLGLGFYYLKHPVSRQAFLRLFRLRG